MSLRLVVFDTLEDAKMYMTGFHYFRNSTEFRSFCLKIFPLCSLMFFEDVSLPSSVLAFVIGAGEEDRLVSDHRTSLLVLVCLDCVSLLLNIFHVPPTENTLPLSSQRWLSSLVNSW